MLFLIDAVKRNLSLKILLVLTLGGAVVMGTVISFSLSNQREQIRERMTTLGGELSSLAYAGIKHPMSVGDSVSVNEQLLAVKETLEGAEIAICDFNQLIVFATHEERINREVSQLIHNEEALATLRRIMETGESTSGQYFEEEVNFSRYLVTIHPMANSPECFHCHGSSRNVLGGLIIRQTTDATYAAITALRNRTIVISVIGIGALISIIYVLLARLVTRPVTELADKAERIARGDLSVSVPVHTRDSIGVLGASFNYMVAGIKDQIEFANSLKGAIADPLFLVDTEMVITYMNEACAQLTGFKKEEVEGKLTCREIFQSDICDSTCPVRYCFESGEPVKGIRVAMTDRSGRTIPLMASASSLRDAHGTLVGGIEICRDITDVLEAERLRYIKKTAEREEDQRKYLEKRAENLLAVLSVASEGNLKARAEVSGKGEVMDAIAHHANLMLDNLGKLYERISSFSRELELEVARRTMMLREKTLLLERANRELRELDRLKSSFLANMSHELRTPMNSIIGYTELMLDRLDGEINDEQEKSLIKVDNNAKHLLQLINDILDMSKIESGKLELDPRVIDIRGLIESVVTSFETALNKKGLSLQLDFDEQFSKVYIDEDKIRQVLINLLSNAIKFTHQGEITIHVRPSDRGVRSGEPPLFVEVAVEDTGIGIRGEDLSKLFDKFSQIDVSTIRQYEGTGLGLSIARGLVVLHKGVIWAESIPEQGTRFCFTLPARKEILDKPADPIIEMQMAEGLARCFERSEEMFLQTPRYAGETIKCWEYTHCGQTSCPAYGSKESRCWLIFGTHCKGTEVAAYPEKVEFCKGCEIIERLILEEFEETEQMRPVIGFEEIRKPVKTILAIDDNPEIIELIKKYLGDQYNVVGVLESEQAVEKAQEINPVAITLDILMPKKDGWHVLQDLKMNPRTQDIPVIILSIVDDKKQGFSLGAAEYLLKPIDKQLLLRKLKSLERISRIKKVLLVEHEPGTVELIGQVLDEAGYGIVTADNDRDAIRLIEEEKPDLIVMELIRSEASGVDLIEYIKTEEGVKNTPLIIIAHKYLSDEEIDELDGRIQAILHKGILSDEDLLHELKNILMIL
ncbi:response regulator [Thermodesulfobacteriota bacterium]